MQKALPKGWKTALLGDCCNIVVGKTPSREKEEYWGKGNKWITISDMKGDVISATKETVTDKAVSQLRMRMLPADTLLYSFKLSIGKTSFTQEPCYTNEAIAGLIPREANIVDKKYLRYALALATGFEAHHAAKGLCLNQEKLRKLKFVLPPLPVQHRIVEILDEADNLRKLRQQADDKMKELIPALFVEMFGDPATNPKGWPVKMLDYVGNFRRGPFGGALKKEIFVKDGYKVYEQKNAIYNDFYIGKYFVDDNKYREMIQFAVKPDDLIISCSGTMGKVAIVPNKAKPGIINQALLKITPDQKLILPVYLKLIIESQVIQNTFYKNTAGSAMQNVASVGTLKKINIPLPPLTLQHDFFKNLTEAENEIIRQAEGRQKLDGLFDSLMHRAFNGELVQ